MDLIVAETGDARCIYGEELDLHTLGHLTITRASHVEPDSQGRWLADMGPSGVPVLGRFVSRISELWSEREWLSGSGF
jgi:hypothetical protein